MSSIQITNISLSLLFLLAVNLYGAERKDLSALIDLAMTWSPRIRVAEQQVEQAVAEQSVLLGFFDPSLHARAEHFNPPDGGSESLLHGRVVVPAFPGVYLNAAVEERIMERVSNPAGGQFDRLARSSARLGLTVPLLQDRGWRQWRLSDLSADYARQMAEARYLTARQDVRRDVELRYLALMESGALKHVADLASERTEHLLYEAEVMVSVRALPAYQIYAARSAVALRREEVEFSVQSVDVGNMRLVELIAAPTLPDIEPVSVDEFIEWANQKILPDSYSASEFILSRGSYKSLIAEMDSTRAMRDLEFDRLRSNFDFVLEGVVQGEDPDSFFGSGRYASERNAGVAAGLIWSRQWGYRAEKARVDIRNSRLIQMAEELREIEQRVFAELEIAHKRFVVAKRRLKLASSAADDARRALTSEDERFRLGDGRSRNVLDAQKDLTDTLKRQIVTASEVLRAYCDFNHAAGYALDPGSESEGVK